MKVREKVTSRVSWQNRTGTLTVRIKLSIQIISVVPMPQEDLERTPQNF